MTAHQPESEARAEYLWDRGGTPDAEVMRLEHALAPLRYQHKPLTFRDGSPPANARTVAFSARMPLRAAAALALFISGVWAISLFSSAVEDVGTVKELRNTMAASGAMQVVAIGGQPRVAGQRVRGNSSLRAGQWVETDATSQAEITVADYGTVKVEPDSRLRLVHAGADEHRMELARGALSAVITAPPRLFVVDTPAATAFDLGCAYRMIVDESGDGEIKVTMGWVSMEMGSGRQPSVVPWGAMCLTRKGSGIGTPFYDDASDALRRALEQFDFERAGPDALKVVLAEARDDDSLTLWHLLSRTSGEERGWVFDRLASLAPPPTPVTRERIMRGDSLALEIWRDTFVWSPRTATSPRT